MKAVCFIFLFLFCSLSSYAQVIGFEEKVPETFKVSGKGEVKLSSLFYKEGESSNLVLPCGYITRNPNRTLSVLSF